MNLMEKAPDARALGTLYRDGDVVVREGDEGDCMYVIQRGQVEVLQEAGGVRVRLALLGENDYFGEMAIFDRERRSATVRAIGEVRLLKIDKKTFLHRIHEDPSLAFRIIQKMSQRIRELDAKVVRHAAAASH